MDVVSIFQNLSDNVRSSLGVDSESIPMYRFVLNLLLTGVLCYALGKFYERFGGALSNRRRFAKIFVPLGVTTTLIITIVKSSLSLSLGLVGALSIVRFRAAIKEPEELVFLFINIAIGLGLGANQPTLVFLGFVVTVICIYFQYDRTTKEDVEVLMLSVASSGPGRIVLEDVAGLLEKRCSKVSLKRFDESKSKAEAVFIVGFRNFQDLVDCKSDLLKLSDSFEVSFFDNRLIM